MVDYSVIVEVEGVKLCINFMLCINLCINFKAPSTAASALFITAI